MLRKLLDRVVLVNVDRMTPHGQDCIYVREVIPGSKTKWLVQEESPSLYYEDDDVAHKEDLWIAGGYVEPGVGGHADQMVQRYTTRKMNCAVSEREWPK